jgi:hypothetical protein
MSLEVRAAALEEARKCLRYASQQTVETPELWANLLGAIANLVLASVPDAVFATADRLAAQRRADNDRVRKHLKDKLNVDD